MDDILALNNLFMNAMNKPIIPISSNTTITLNQSGKVFELNSPNANATITLPTPINGFNAIFVGNNSSSYIYTFTTPSGIIQYGGYTGTSSSIVTNGAIGKQYYLASDGNNYFVFETSNSYIIPRNTVVFTSSGSWTVPQGVTQILVSGCGGGGGGGASSYISSTNYYGGTGGGAGQSTIKQSISVTPGHSLSITIGAGGGSSANGGNTTIVDSTSSTTLLTLSGGSIYYSFGLGEPALSYAGYGGPGASGPFGRGALCGYSTTGFNATGYGSGGGGAGGASGSYAGGSGAQGILIIEW